MRTLLLLLTALFSSQVMAMGESCEKKYIDAYGFSKTAAQQVCGMNEYGRKLVRKGYSISHAQKLAETETAIVVDKCEEDTELMGYKEEFAIEICKLNYCEKMLVMEGSSTELAQQECKEESTVVDSNDQLIEEVEVTIEEGSLL